MQIIDPIQNLCSNSKSKDITANFYSSLETIISFSDEPKNLVNSSFLRKINCSTHDLDEETQDILLRKYTLNKSFFSIEYNATILDFLIFKLIENFKRLYSANKGASKHIYRNFAKNNSESLEEQQNYIYKSINLVLPLIDNLNEYSLYKNTFLGKTVYCSKIDVVYFLSFHEYLLQHNEENHLNLLKFLQKTEQIDISVFKKYFQHLNYPKEKHDFICQLINYLPKELEQIILDLSIIHSEKRLKKELYFQKNFSMVSTLCTKTVLINSSISEQTKKQSLILFFIDGHHYFQDFNVPIEFSTFIIDKFDKEIENIQEHILKLVPLNEKNIHHRTKFLISLVRKISEPTKLYQCLISKTFNVGTLNKNLINLLYPKFDFSDEKLITSTSRLIINSQKDNNRKILLNQLLSEPGVNQKKIISSILSMDFNLSQELSSIILKIQLESNLSKPQKNKKLNNGIKI